MAAPAKFTLSHWGNTQNNINNNVWDVCGSGAPSNGTSGTGAGQLGPGSTYTDFATGIIYSNTGTLLSPTWLAGINGSSPTITTPAMTIANGSFVAAGSTRADAVAITNTGFSLVLVTGANATKGAVLPPALTGSALVVFNDNAANAVLKMYAAGSDTIRGTAGSTAFSMAAKTAAIFACMVAGDWQTLPLLPS